MGFFQRLFTPGWKKCLDEALRFGIRATEVERLCPSFDARGGMELKSDRVWRYAKDRRAGAEPPTWSLLMRGEVGGSSPYSGHVFESDWGSPSPEFHELLVEIGNSFDEELFEFEGTRTEVAVFWEAWGGRAMVEKLNRYLDALSRF